MTVKCFSPTNLIFYISTAACFLKHIHRSHVQCSVNRAGPSEHDEDEHLYAVQHKIKPDLLDSNMFFQQYFDNTLNGELNEWKKNPEYQPTEGKSNIFLM